MKQLFLYEIVSKLGPLEKTVLELVNINNKPKDVVDKLNKKGKKYAYTTIMTILDKLYKKGYLQRKKIGKTYYYSKSYSDKLLFNKTGFHLTKQLINFFSVKKILVNVFFLLIFLPLLNFISLPYITGLLTTIFLSTCLIIFLNIVYSLHLNGFFEYITLIFFNPKLLIKYWSINFSFLKEVFSFIIFIVLLIIGVIFIFKLSSKSSKNYYQFEKI